MKKIVLSILIAFLLTGLPGCEGPVTPEEKVYYNNPVYAPVFADPAVIRHEGTYYAYATEDYGEWKKDDDPLNNISMVVSVPILKSDDLIKWYYAGPAFRGAAKPSWGTAGANVWAPDVVKIGEKFVMYYSLSTWGDPDPGIGIAVADHPAGPWTDRGKLFTSLEIGVNNSIDPAVFYGDNKLYMIWGSFRGLYGIELTSDGLGLKDGLEAAKNNKVHIAGLDTSTSWNGDTYEGAYVITKDGYYYMFVSSGTCCEGYNSTYNVRVARSQNPLGPYIDHNGADMRATNKGSVVVKGGADFVGVGHNSIAADDGGNMFMLYHGFDRKLSSDKYGVTNRRSLLIDKLIWNDGWPEVEGKIAGRKDMSAPVINKK